MHSVVVYFILHLETHSHLFFYMCLLLFDYLSCVYLLCVLCNVLRYKNSCLLTFSSSARFLFSDSLLVLCHSFTPFFPLCFRLMFLSIVDSWRLSVQNRRATVLSILYKWERWCLFLAPHSVSVHLSLYLQAWENLQEMVGWLCSTTCPVPS